MKQKNTELNLPNEVRLIEPKEICQNYTKHVENVYQDIQSWIEAAFSGRRLQLDIMVLLMRRLDKPCDSILIWNDTAKPEDITKEYNLLLASLGYRLKGGKWKLKRPKVEEGTNESNS